MNEVVAIDVGYGNTKFCAANNGTLKTGHFPSIATLQVGVADRGAVDLSNRELITVIAGNDTFRVGPDAIDTLSAHEDRNRNLAKNYVETPQHLALLRGALHYLGKANVDLLVTGLPVNDYAHHKKRMADKLRGLHAFPKADPIHVHEVLVIPQPMGGFVNYFMGTNQIGALKAIKSLTIDIGYFTVDWLVCRGLKMQEERCGSVPGGMSMILDRLKHLISEDRQTSFSDINLIDAGIQNGFKTRLNGQEYDFSHLAPKINSHIRNIMQSVLSSVGSLDDIDIIVMVGGGAPIYKETAHEVLNHRDITVPENSLYANVMGFYITGFQRLNSRQ